MTSSRRLQASKGSAPKGSPNNRPTKIPKATGTPKSRNSAKTPAYPIFVSPAPKELKSPPAVLGSKIPSPPRIHKPTLEESSVLLEQSTGSTASTASTSKSANTNSLPGNKVPTPDPQAHLNGGLAAMDLNSDLQEDALRAIQEKTNAALQSKLRQKRLAAVAAANRGVGDSYVYSYYRDKLFPPPKAVHSFKQNTFWDKSPSFSKLASRPDKE